MYKVVNPPCENMEELDFEGFQFWTLRTRTQNQAMIFSINKGENFVLEFIFFTPIGW